MTDVSDYFAGWMEDEVCFQWGKLFDSDWGALAARMTAKAAELGFTQRDEKPYLIWQKNGQEQARWVFVDDPADIDSIRAIYNNQANITSPVCYVVVRQPDSSDARGEVVFDIFKLSPKSYLWHHNRVYTPPRKKQG